MAEARQAVGFRLTVTHDGHLDMDYDHGAEVLRLILESGKRAYKKKLARLGNTVRNALFPVGLEVIGGGVAMLTGIHLAGVDLGITKGLLEYLKVKGLVWALCCVLSACVTALLVVAAVRFLLRLLFSYQGWMYLSRKQQRNPPLYVKAWFLLVRALTSLGIVGHESRPGKPMLYSYQGALPTLPVPAVADTIKRYLRSVRPLMDDKEYTDMTELAKEFETGLAPKLQRYLWLKWLWSDNYVSDWWEEYVYLRGRSPLMINSNYYCVDAIYKPVEGIQSARAANAVHAAFAFRRILQKQESGPVMLQRIVPLCSRQYERIFNTTRIPREGSDKLAHLDDSTHVVVMHGGRYYRMPCYDKGRLLEPAELQIQIQGILDDNTSPDPGEPDMAAMTAVGRDEWAKVRKEFFSSSSVNRASLSKIITAAFILCLDDYSYDHDEEDPTKLNDYCRLMMHGKGNDRWFDKSFCLVVGANGRMGMNIEHSWADAPILSHFWEYVLYRDSLLGYDDDGNCRGMAESGPPPRPTKLKWDFPDAAAKAFSRSLEQAKAAIQDIDLFVLCHDEFGKNEMKKAKMSPDAFVQVAFQLAYNRRHGRFCLTYEAAMTRLFREGRTETVRPCTIEATEFAKAMDDKTKTKEEVLSLLCRAQDAHLLQVQDSMTGRGVDRHLFCLYVVSRYLEMDSPFLSSALGQPWRLSTSQTAVRGEFVEVAKNPELISVGGGFGPVDDQGYGVSYLFVGEERVFFHVSCKKSNESTDAKEFAMEIKKALADIKALCETGFSEKE